MTAFLTRRFRTPITTVGDNRCVAGTGNLVIVRTRVLNREMPTVLTAQRLEPRGCGVNLPTKTALLVVRNTLTFSAFINRSVLVTRRVVPPVPLVIVGAMWVGITDLRRTPPTRTPLEIGNIAVLFPRPCMTTIESLPANGI